MEPVDLRSDTVTQPTLAMKRAMVAAPLGDDVLGDDPTVRALEERCAAEAGKEAAIFVPSGSMANLIAIKIATSVGDEVLMHGDAHPFNYEAGSAAAVAGVQIRPLPGARGILDLDATVAAVRPADDHFAPAALLCVEDTTNRGGGAVYPLKRLDALASAAQARGLCTHMDGARAWHAVIASGESLARRAHGYDTVSFCFSKALGAPVGSVLCLDRARERHARRVRKMLGGGMRQSGMLAAAALHALDHHVTRLAEDHQRARDLFTGLSIEGLDVQTPETNMVYVNAPHAQQWQDRLEEVGVRCFATGPDRLRLVLHMGVDTAAVRRAVKAFASVRDALGAA